jgi:hypothetical protein
MLNYVLKDILWVIGEITMRYGTLILDAEDLRDISVLTTALIAIQLQTLQTSILMAHISSPLAVTPLPVSQEIGLILGIVAR